MAGGTGRVAPFGHPRIKAGYGSPRIFAVCCVLRRLMVPRHPSCARIRLTEKRRIVSPGPGAYVAILSTQKLCSFQRTCRRRAPAMRAPPFGGKSARKRPARGQVVGVTGIGPVTSSLSGTRSNQLSYTPGDGWLGRASGAEGVRSRSAWAADDAKQGEAAHGSGPFKDRLAPPVGGDMCTRAGRGPAHRPGRPVARTPCSLERR